jgi:voltage-gated potassium channel
VRRAADHLGPLPQLRWRLREIYFGHGRSAELFTYALLAIDGCILAQFLWLTFSEQPRWHPGIEIALGLLVFLDMAARFWAAPRRLWRFLWVPTAADGVVVLSFFLPFASSNLGFLRILSAVRVVRAYHILHRLRRHSAWIRQHVEVLDAVLDLFMFIFLISAFVWLSQHRINEDINTYIDALYFTVTTLTTTGFGDITLEGTHGRLLSMLVMMAGIGLFFRLVQAVFRPEKVRHTCPRCGLLRHDPDAVHCKHCGEILNIPNEGG